MPLAASQAFRMARMRAAARSLAAARIAKTYLPLPERFRVRSTSSYVAPGVVVGGKGSPLTAVTSRRSPPRGPIS